jgi:hypothetical protein
MSISELDARHVLYLIGFSVSQDTMAELSSDSSQGEENRPVDPSFKTVLGKIGIECIENGGVEAWVKRIDRAEFEGSEGEKNLSDLQWITPRVLAHETVVSQLAQQTAFFPSRFGTLFSSVQSLNNLMQGAASDLQSFFCRVGRKREWGIKFFGDMDKAASILARRSGIVSEGKQLRGAEYLRLRQFQKQCVQEKMSLLHDALSEPLHWIQTWTSDIATRKVNSAQKNDEHEMLLQNIAVLASESESQNLTSWVRGWNSQATSDSCIRIELTGPWAAYSFCPSLSQAGTEDGAACLSIHS